MRLAEHIILVFLVCLLASIFSLFPKYYYVQRQCKWAQASLGTVIACVYLYSN